MTEFRPWVTSVAPEDGWPIKILTHGTRFVTDIGDGNPTYDDANVVLLLRSDGTVMWTVVEDYPVEGEERIEPLVARLAQK